MSNPIERDSLAEMLELLKRKAPELLDIISAESEKEFNTAFDHWLVKAVAGLEKNKVNYCSLDEEPLSAILAQALSMPGLSATCETNSNGHVDITIEAEHCHPARTKLAEAKVWDGPQYHISGLEQLLGYTTGRESRGMVISYVKRPNIAGLVAKLREKMNADKPCQQIGDTQDHDNQLRWAFLSSHNHSSGEEIDVSHVCCDLYHPAKPSD